MNILPIQLKFDKEIPLVLGNAEYRAEFELLMAMDGIITVSGIENQVIQHFLDTAYAEKSASQSGTDKAVKLTAKEIERISGIAIFALRSSNLRKRLGLSLRGFALALSHSDLYKWFCRINRFTAPKIPGKSTIAALENMLTKELVEKMETLLFRSVQAETTALLDEPVDFSRCYIDSTCIMANIHFPVDWLLFRDSLRTMMLAVKRIRQFGLLSRMPYEPKVFIKKMNNLSMEMTFARRRKDSKRKRKNILRRMKNLLKKAAKHAIKHFGLLDKNYQQVDLTRRQAEQILLQISNVTIKVADVIKQAHERIIGQRKVENNVKILSIYEDDVNVIVRKKAGAEVEFGNTLFLAEQKDGLIVDWQLFQKQAPADSRLLQEFHQRIANKLDIKVELIAGDRGFDSKTNQKYFEKHKIFNGICPRNPEQLQQRLEEEQFCDAQNRRSQTEARISILGRCFCGNPMLQKGFEHREIHMGLSILSHNLWVLARLKLAQQTKLKEAA
jgi:hypothetical protein